MPFFRQHWGEPPFGGLTRPAQGGSAGAVDTALDTPGYGYAVYLRHFVIYTYCVLFVKHSPLRDESVLRLSTLSYRTRSPGYGWAAFSLQCASSASANLDSPLGFYPLDPLPRHHSRLFTSSVRHPHSSSSRLGRVP
jgi:hypothetical protein